MIPQPRLIVILLLLLIPFVAGIWIPVATTVGQYILVFLLVLLVVDLSLSSSFKHIKVERKVSEAMSVGVPNPVKLEIQNRNPQTVKLQLHDEPPQPSTIEGLPATVVLRPQRETDVTYHALPARRGKNSFGRLFLRMKSRFGFWLLFEERAIPQPVDIFPDIQTVRQVELLARQNRLAEAGVRMSRFLGRGSEFERLREYRRGDEYRSIDWKATARRRELISREYTVEKNQNLLFLLDCGRGMCNEVDNISHFDRALNSLILLSYVALRQGDTVGVLAFSNRLEQSVRPMRGKASLQKMVRQMYELQPRYESSDYALMAEQLRKRYRKRSLVILLTYAMDEVHLESISRQLRQIRSPHLMLTAFLMNEPLQARYEVVPENNLEAFQVAAAGEMIATQSKQLQRLRQSGLLVMESLPTQLSSRLINEYLDIKARHLL
ncbi:hypothetical protein Pla110_04660 [Polystyrenella longa]|uniref:DUF58 domain-containing protein n=1 Tax=Polystyrenella longa TaxID=2528007 RepID=A0A518CHR3_9PLAN|nr:DUF58 domain-containing protein [Polystyrenella longa]QDU78762.1 hypothetical protein Pla110_04660 [Polystyrenella longa]